MSLDHLVSAGEPEPSEHYLKGKKNALTDQAPVSKERRKLKQLCRPLRKRQ